MSVKLVGITKPTEYVPCTTANELVAYAAKVSNPARQDDFSSADRLIRYLIKENHWSPFEMVNLVMEIKTTRDISRQILRHRSFSFQEFSQRYAHVDSFITDREFRIQDTVNRQNSIEVNSPGLQSKWQSMQEMAMGAAMGAYNWAKAAGLAKEQARSVLPEGLSNTTLYMNGTLRSWIHYCDLRMANGTQKEHAIIAKQAWAIISEQFPELVKTMDAINLTKSEAKSKLEIFDYLAKNSPEIIAEAVSATNSKISLDNS